MRKTILKSFFILICTGLFSLIYWRLVIYHGAPAFHLLSFSVDGESAYDVLFAEIFLLSALGFFLLYFIFRNITEAARSCHCTLRKEGESERPSR